MRKKVGRVFVLIGLVVLASLVIYMSFMAGWHALVFTTAMCLVYLGLFLQ